MAEALIAPPRDTRPALQRAISWVRRNLFAGPANTLLTVLTLWLLISAIPPIWHWAVTNALVAPATLNDCRVAEGACWAFIQDKAELILYGPYPPEERWRPTLAVALFALMAVASCFPRLWHSRRQKAGMTAAWVGTLVAYYGLMAGGLPGLPGVPTRLWGGLPLTVILAFGGVSIAFLVSIIVALGRRSEMPVIRWVSIAYIELFRGVPLIGLLYMAKIMLPLLMDADVQIHDFFRAQLAFVLFFSAYLAEAIRGGLQAIPRGQYAAAKALGLGYWQTTTRIIMPQVLRIVLPSLVNIFIAAFKDTSLVVVISMFDLMGSARSAMADPNWWGLYVEAYVFVAAIYLVICASMSWYARKLERRLAAGVRRD